MQPKATVHRTTDMITRFASLPSGSAAASTLSMDQPAGASKQPRAILGIDISAVHSAVLSGGVTRIPGKSNIAFIHDKRHQIRRVVNFL